MALCLVSGAWAPAEARGFRLVAMLAWTRSIEGHAQGKQGEFVVAPSKVGAQGKKYFDIFNAELQQFDKNTVDIGRHQESAGHKADSDLQDGHDFRGKFEEGSAGFRAKFYVETLNRDQNLKLFDLPRLGYSQKALHELDSGMCLASSVDYIEDAEHAICADSESVSHKGAKLYVEAQKVEENLNSHLHLCW